MRDLSGRHYLGFHSHPFLHRCETEGRHLQCIVVALNVLHYVEIVVDSGESSVKGQSFLEFGEELVALVSVLEAKELMKRFVGGGGQILLQCLVSSAPLVSDCRPVSTHRVELQGGCGPQTKFFQMVNRGNNSSTGRLH